MDHFVGGIVRSTNLAFKSRDTLWNIYGRHCIYVYVVNTNIDNTSIMILSRAEAQLAFEQRQKRRTARKAVKRTDGSASGAADDVTVTVTGRAAGHTDVTTDVTSSLVTNDDLDSSRNTFFFNRSSINLLNCILFNA